MSAAQRLVLLLGLTSLPSCMRARGFVLEERSDIDVGRVGDGLRATYMLNADNWKRDYKKWLPKTIREWVTP